MKRFLFDTSVLVDYIHEKDVAPDVLVLAARHGQGYISTVSFMELWLPRHKTDDEIRQEVGPVYRACDTFGFKVLTCFQVTIRHALRLIEYCHTLLGRSAVTDSLLIASGISLRAILITKDKRWKEVVEQLQKKGNLKPKVMVMDPVEFVQTYAW